jgi:multicomponent Na+:H+ antiporter subunit C
VSHYAYFVAGWLIVIGAFGIVRSRNLVQSVVCLAVAQSGTYVLLLSLGYQWGAAPPLFSEPATKPTLHVVDPLVQAMTLTDIVVSATVTSMLLAIAIQIHKRSGTIDPDLLNELRG